MRLCCRRKRPIGQYPVEAVTIMEKIILRTEQDWPYQRIRRCRPGDAGDDLGGRHHPRPARQVAETISAQAIVTFTASGSTSLRASRERPPVPILALTPSEVVARNLALAWGVHPIKVDRFTDFDRNAGPGDPGGGGRGLRRSGRPARWSPPGCRWRRPEPPTRCTSSTCRPRRKPRRLRSLLPVASKNR